LLFYGPSGAGKKTRAMAFLREVYGESAIDKLRFEHMEMKAPSGAKVELKAIATNYHVDVTPRLGVVLISIFWIIFSKNILFEITNKQYKHVLYYSLDITRDYY